MPWLAEFFTANMWFVLFVHGLALFSLGFGLALDITRSQASSDLHTNLTFLISSAFLMAASAWIEMAARGDLVSTDAGIVFGLGVFVRVAGALCLLAFGANLLSVARRGYVWLRWLPVAFLAVWGLLVALAPGSTSGTVPSGLWLFRAEAWAGSVLLLPGGIAAGLGLVHCGQTFDSRGLAGIARDCRGAGMTAALSGVVCGLAVPVSSSVPVSPADADRLLAAIGVPHGLVLAALSVATAIFLMRAVRGVETDRLLAEKTSTEERWRSQQTLLEAASKRCQELQTANAELARANEAKSRFLAIAAHDLKSPLAATQSYLHVLLGGFTGELQPRQREMLERSSDRIQDLLALISDLMDTTKVETGQLIGERQPVDLATVTVASVENVRLPIAYKGIKLDLSLPDGECRVLGSKHRLQQLLTNLLSNAAKYTPEMGTIALTVKELGGWVHIEVADTGPGIPPDALPHIFEEFYKVDSADGRRNLGLGLFIARKIVEAHGGEIHAESPCSDTGAGTRFLIKLPRHVPS